MLSEDGLRHPWKPDDLRGCPASDIRSDGAARAKYVQERGYLAERPIAPKRPCHNIDRRGRGQQRDREMHQ